MPKLTQEWMLKTLTSLGFKNLDAEVYISLTRNGSQEVRDLAEALKTDRMQVYRSLRDLKAKGVVQASNGRPAEFSALSLELVLDELIKANVEEARRLEREKEKILSRWQVIIKEDSAS
ncbi:MAG TPA: helix-turn-helix domain-containing protein [Candidatus Bathyarchaeia archaeon]